DPELRPDPVIAVVARLYLSADIHFSRVRPEFLPATCSNFCQKLSTPSMRAGPTMPSISVRNLDDDLIARLKRRAARRGHSAEAEVRDILRQALSAEAEPSFDDLAAELRALTAGRHPTTAEQMQRDGRDERGPRFSLFPAVLLNW